MTNRLWARVIMIALILTNLYLLKSVWLGSIVGLFLLINYGRLSGRLLFPNAEHFFQTVFGTLTFIGANSIILWISFYLYGINSTIFSLALMITSIFLELWLYRNEQWSNGTMEQQSNKTKLNFWHNLKVIVFDLKPKSVIIIYLALVTVNFVQLFFARTSEAINSPWNLLPKSFFFLFIAATLCLIIILFKNKLHKFSLFLTILHFFLFSSVALIVYKIGYGYDPFLHLAAIKEILIKGFILPKTLYYIGEYTLIIFLHYLTRLPVEFLNQALLPFSFALFFPTSIYYGLTKGLNFEKDYALIASLAGLFLPISYFIATTPQGLTNLLVLIIIFLSLIPTKSLPRRFLFFLCFLATTIHPLFGVPITLFIIFTSIEKRLIQIPIALAGLFVFPGLFIANSLINGFKVSLHYPDLKALFNFSLLNKKYFDFVPDLIHSIGLNIKVLFSIGVLFGIILILKNKKFKQFSTYLGAAVILLINYFLTKSTLNFEFATNQNQLQFISRIFELALYFLLPIFLYLIYHFIKFNFGKNNNFFGKLFVVLTILSTLSVSLYYSYPIKDNYKNSQEYNVTSTDISAVHFIAEYAKTDYIVLGNQMLAAAAINELGFTKYYNGNFYYSIPDGRKNNLYQFYEKMVFDAPNRDFALKAMKLAGVNQAFFVASDYWSNSKNIVTLAKSTADSWQSIDNGKNTIFIYNELPIDK